MLTLLQIEMMKMRKSAILKLCAVGALCAPLLNWVIALNMQQKEGTPTNFYFYMEQSNLFIAMIIGTLLYGLLTTYVFEREFSEDMMKHLLTVPISRTHLFISKLMVVALGMLALTCTAFVGGLVLSFISGFSGINNGTVLQAGFQYVKTWAAFLPLMIPVILITVVFRNFVAPIAFSIIAEIILFVVMQSQYIALYPWAAPILAGTNILSEAFLEPGLMVGTPSMNLMILAGLGILSLLCSVVYLKTQDLT